MDVHFFLVERTRFVRAFYDCAAAPFLETKRLIEAQEPPLGPAYSEDGERPFLTEWIEADTAIEVLGRTCLSMLSDSLKLYFMTWEREFGLSCQKACPNDFKRGFIHGYRACFKAACRFDWRQSPVDLDLLEQIVLARNDAQHPERITSLDIHHRGSLRKAGRRLFFAHEFERAAMSDPEGGGMVYMNPTLHFGRDALFAAIAEVETFASWLEERLLDARYPGRLAE